MMAKKKKEKGVSEFQLILLGEEWTGKSSAGNTILGRAEFKIDSDTEHVMQSSGVIEGRYVTVVDTPGWNSECSPDVPLKMLKKGHTSVSLMCQGFHILLLTIPISQDQKWNQKVAHRLSNALRLFNDDIWKHTMLLFTRSDLLHSTGLEGYLKGSGQPFQSLVQKCEGRYHVLNNYRLNDHKQVRELLEKIEQMVQENSGQSLQLGTNEQKVAKLRVHEMDTLRDNRMLVERFFKMEKYTDGESCFRLEDYMFKSLRPQDNDTPNPTEHTDGDKENSDVGPTVKNTCTEVEDTGMNRIVGDEEKNKKHLQHYTVQRNTPQTSDNSCDLSIICSFHSDVSNHQHSE